MFLTVDTLEMCDVPPVRGTLVLGINGTGRYVGRGPGGVEWIAWDQSYFATMCEAFDEGNASRKVAMLRDLLAQVQARS